MAYFRSNEKEETRKNEPVSYPQDETDAESHWTLYPDHYDEDGFDFLADDEETEELSDEERETVHQNRAKVLFSAGNLAGIIFGTVIILLLIAFLFMMISFLRTDITRNFTLLQTQF